MPEPPRPVIDDNGRWTSEPEWDATALPYLPRPAPLELLAGRRCLLIPRGVPSLGVGYDYRENPAADLAPRRIDR